MSCAAHLAGLVAVVVGSACIHDDLVDCGDGTLCPRGLQCHQIDGTTTCVTAEQLDACRDFADDEPCGEGACYQEVCVEAVLGWEEWRSPWQGRSGHVAAYDTLCGLSVIGGNNAVGTLDSRWNRSAGFWTHQDLAVQRTWAAAAYDSDRGCIFLFGGQVGGGELGDAWESCGCSDTWTEVLPTSAMAPGARASASMVYDPVNHRFVLFGGVAGGTALGDTWEFDPVARTWLPTAPNTHPSQRHAAAMAWDSVNNRAVLFGGAIDSKIWLYANQSWTSVAAAPAPEMRRSATLALDESSDRLVLFGGQLLQDNSIASDTWELSTAATPQWTAVAVPINPPARARATATYDPGAGAIVLVAGFDASGEPLEDVWEYAMGSWRDASPKFSPSERSASLALDRGTGRVVLHGGLTPAGAVDETWTFDGEEWTQHMTPGPSARWGHSLAYDVLRKRVVLFGGRPRNGPELAETWDWDGMSWAQSPASGPSARIYGAFAGDILHHGVVLFGGTASGGAPIGDSWVYDGATWTAVPATEIPAQQTQLAYDEYAEHVVLLARQGDELVTWVYEDEWKRLDVKVAPPTRYGFSLLTSPWTGRVLMFGGHDVTGVTGGVFHSDMRELVPDGDTWTWREVPLVGAQPAVRPYPGLAPLINPLLQTSSHVRSLVLFGGTGGFGDTWLLRRRSKYSVQ